MFVALLACRYMVYVHPKERNTNKNFVLCFLIRNVPHFYGLPLDLCGRHIAVIFAKRAAIFANAPQFREKCRNPWIAVLYKTAHFQE